MINFILTKKIIKHDFLKDHGFQKAMPDLLLVPEVLKELALSPHVYALH